MGRRWFAFWLLVAGVWCVPCSELQAGQALGAADPLQTRGGGSGQGLRADRGSRAVDDHGHVVCRTRGREAGPRSGAGTSQDVQAPGLRPQADLRLHPAGVEGRGLNRYGGRRRCDMPIPPSSTRSPSWSATSRRVDDPQIEKALQKIRYARPDCLDYKKNKSTTQRFVGLARIAEEADEGPEKKQLGPDGQRLRDPQSAVAQGVLHAGRLGPAGRRDESRGRVQPAGQSQRYTVQVATFRGRPP